MTPSPPEDSTESEEMSLKGQRKRKATTDPLPNGTGGSDHGPESDSKSSLSARMTAQQVIEQMKPNQEAIQAMLSERQQTPPTVTVQAGKGQAGNRQCEQSVPLTKQLEAWQQDMRAQTQIMTERVANSERKLLTQHLAHEGEKAETFQKFIIESHKATKDQIQSLEAANRNQYQSLKEDNLAIQLKAELKDIVQGQKMDFMHMIASCGGTFRDQSSPGAAAGILDASDPGAGAGMLHPSGPAAGAGIPDLTGPGAAAGIPDSSNPAAGAWILLPSGPVAGAGIPDQSGPGAEALLVTSLHNPDQDVSGAGA